MKRICTVIAAIALATAAHAQSSGTVTNHAFPIGKGPGVTGYTSLLCGSAQLAVGQAAADPICRTVTGDATLSAAGALTFNVVNANVGSFGSATQCVTLTLNAKGLATAASQTACTVAVGSISGLGTGVATALGVNVGTAGAFVVNGGALGTPSSGVATNLTGTAAGLTAGTASAVAVGGITGLGSGIPTWLVTASSANLRAAMTDETGTGALYFQGGDIGTPSAGVLTNATGLPRAGMVNGVARSVIGVTGNAGAAPADIQGTASQFFVLNSAGTSLAFQTMSGDCTLSGPAITCTKAAGVAPIVSTKATVFTSDGTFTPDAKMQFVDIEACGGGAGGGSAVGAANSTFGGGGGGSGGYTKARFTAADIGASKAVDIGAKGTGGAAGAGANGNVGADTTLGSTLLVAKGGFGGFFGSVGQVPQAGSGGVAGSTTSGTGVVTAAGTPGLPGYYSTVLTSAFPSGNGGSGIFGGGAKGVLSTGSANTGTNAGNYCSGGAGAGSNNIAANAAGGDGSDGFLRTVEYLGP